MILVNQLFGLEIMGSIIRMIIIRVGFMFIRWILSIVSDTYRCVLFLFISCFVSIMGGYSIYLWVVNTAIIVLYTAVNRIIYSISTGNIIGIIAWLIVLFGLAYLIPLLGLSPVLLAQETDRDREEEIIQPKQSINQQNRGPSL